MVRDSGGECCALHDLLPASTLVLEEEVASAGGPLNAAEASSVERAMTGRRSEFTAGRTLARRAFVQMGLGDRWGACDRARRGQPAPAPAPARAEAWREPA
jgi:hypothetical protein